MTIVKSMKDIISAALEEGCSKPEVGPRLGGLTVGDLITRTLSETFVGPRQ